MHSPARSLVKAWDSIADTLTGDATLKRYLYGFNLVQLDEHSYIADVGCGQGKALEMLEKKGCRNVVGVDISRKLAETTKKRLKNGEALVADAHYLPFQPDCFATVFTFGSIEHWTDPEKAMREIHRVCQRNAVVMTDSYAWKAMQLLGLYDDVQPVDRAIPPKQMATYCNNGFRLAGYAAWDWPPLLWMILKRLFRLAGSNPTWFHKTAHTHRFPFLHYCLFTSQIAFSLEKG